MAEHMDYTGGGYASSGWPESGPPFDAGAPAAPGGSGRQASGREHGGTGPASPAAPPASAEPWREQLKDLGEQAREETVRLAADARDQVAAVVRRRQELLADRLAGVAAALRDAGRRLVREAAGPGTRAGFRPMVAGDAATRGLVELAERAAGEVDRASRYLRRSELRDVVRDLEDQARRRPAAFVGGSFAAGLVLARFFKSSGRQPHEKLAGRQ